MDEPPKRNRVEDQDQEIACAKRQIIDKENIFFIFLKDRKKMEMLRKTFYAIKEGHSMMSVCVKRVTETNARLSEGFSRASCATSSHMEGNTVKKYELGRIFLNGLKILKAFIDKDNPRIPVNDMWRQALAKLLNFMCDDDNQSALFELNEPSTSEGLYALGLAQHLLSPLAVGDGYIIDGSYQGIQENKESCPCKKGEQLLGKFGDTSFGCRKGWHGQSDILMEDAIPVECTIFSDDDMEECLSVSSSTEVKSSEVFCEKDIKQLTAQTIVFSFLQYKYNKEKMKNFLVPCIGISGKKIIAFYYDSVHDVLLATAPVILRAESHVLNPNAIAFLWMTLNYKILCTGITKEMENYKADFFQRVGDCLNMYRNDVIRPCPVKKGPKKGDEEEYGWAYTQPTAEGYCVEVEDSEFLKLKEGNENKLIVELST